MPILRVDVLFPNPDWINRNNAINLARVADAVGEVGIVFKLYFQVFSL